MTENANTPISCGRATPALRPMRLWASVLFFGIPTLTMILAYYVLMPGLIKGGFLPYSAQCIALLVPLTGLLLAGLVGYRLEGRRLSWRAIAARFRWHRMDGRAWLWTLGVWALQLAIWFVLQKLSAWLIAQGFMPVPEGLPAFLDPRTTDSVAALEQATGGLQGNWGFALMSMALLIVNIAGEEVWWRGYVLPRQELAFGKWTWLVHGLMWTGFHAFKWWDLVSLLPLCLGLSYVTHRLRNNSTGFVIHTLQKADFFLVVVPLILIGSP